MGLECDLGLYVLNGVVPPQVQDLQELFLVGVPLAQAGGGARVFRVASATVRER
jgi:hypothetical protein